MPKVTALEQQWRRLMFLCERESSYREHQNHPKLLKLVTQDIETLASRMGFSPQQIETREFRAERKGDRIVRIIGEH